MKITKIFTFDSSHMLDGHDGKCQNLHGHTYKLEVVLVGELIRGGAKDGMLMDFADVKSIVKQQVIEPFDHAFIYHAESAKESQLAQLLESWHMKTLRMAVRTTAEHLAADIFHRLKTAGLPMAAVRLWETATSCAEYEGA